MKPREDATETLQKDLRPLSPYWAFVVRFRVGTALDGGRLTGRVEHIVSGQEARFESLEELLRFMTRVLTTVSHS
jgi:hypothetical protein